VCARVAIVYNEPVFSRYHNRGEEAAVIGVLDAVEAVHRSLLELGYDVNQVPLAPPLKQARNQINKLEADLVFNLFEGFPGYPETEAEIPDILSRLAIPYTGCPGAALRLALDKAKTKVILKEAGIATPDFQLLLPETISAFRLTYPCIVKPVAEDASHGLSEKSVVSNFTSLKEQVELISQSYGGQALVEEFISGREFNVTIIGNANCTVLPVSEIDYLLPDGMPEILTFAAKWQSDSLYFKGTKVICPAEIGPEYQKNIKDTALKTFRRLGCRGYARVDMRQDKRGGYNVIDVNPNPDISPGTGAALQAAVAGINYTRFIENIVQLALEKADDENQYTAYGKRGQASPVKNTEQYARIQTSRGSSSPGSHRQLSA
jgi:D-alanine-D-alanine ligase